MYKEKQAYFFHLPSTLILIPASKAAENLNMLMAKNEICDGVF